jgi:hypothetical protein
MTYGEISQEVNMNYEKPTVVDYGELTQLTAAQSTGAHTDATFPTNTPFTQLTFS